MVPAATIESVDYLSPAFFAGLRPGFALTSVDGQPLRDVIDWMWIACDNEVSVCYVDENGVEGSAVLVRDDGQEWGISFSELLFEPARQCSNRCTFCFMRQLPPMSRPSLSFRDDDYRLSFLQGNFVTFTNATDSDVARIVEQHLSPLRFSLHAIDAKTRLSLIGPRAPRGIEVVEHLLQSGIQIHAQIVLVPGVNDGEELVRTLAWAYERAGILDVGIVPLGYTKYQNTFTKSFDSPETAMTVLDTVEPFRVQAEQERGYAWAYPADEFYCNAFGTHVLDHLPPPESYGDFDMFEDGIGMVRLFADDFLQAGDLLNSVAAVFGESGNTCYFVHGSAQDAFLPRLLDRSPVAGNIVPLSVANEYFGGNVTVTGLLSGRDIAHALDQAHRFGPQRSFAVVQSVVFNADGVTVDDWTIEDISQHAPIPVHVVSCQPSGFLPEIESLLRREGE
ncbi:MAG: DUF512 domain-containing protein [Eggerthellaceae bacterium]|nr:DUF512 domain-containing protein [Eggerthellaceae bacterium]